MKKVEGWMETGDFKHELGDTEHGSPCYVHSTKEGCLSYYPSSDIKWQQNQSVEITRVYVFDADDYDKIDLYSKKNLPEIMALLNDPEFCQAIIDNAPMSIQKKIAARISAASDKAAYGDL